MFSTEKQMVQKFEEYLQSTYGNCYYRELEDLFNVPDFILFDREKEPIPIITFEVTYCNWEKAALKAQHSKKFSNYSYVVLHSNNIKKALQKIDVFERCNIGLAEFTQNNTLQIFHKPQKREAISQKKYEKLISLIKDIETLTC